MRLGKRDLYNAIAVLAIIAILVYVIVRTTLFLFAEYELTEKFFAILLIFGEFFVLLHSLGYALNIFKIFVKQKQAGEEEPIKKELKEEPTVAILVAARDEPKEVLEDTFIAINAVNYKNKEVFFLDDSSEGKYRKEADELADQLNLRLFRRQARHGAKAGIVNDCLKNLTQKYIVIFDADQNPLPEFLNTLIPMMENDERLAFIQTPQFYSNIDQSRVARGAGFQQSVFYEYICEGKSLTDAMFCCGTNIVFRREALTQVGGLDESTVTEDFATSVKLHSRGWRSLYYNHVCAFGMGPENLNGYFKQQFRWAAGTIAILKKLIWQFLTRPFSLRPVQWWEYFLSSSYYLIGLAFFILMICPVIYLFFNIPSFFARPEIYFLSFMPYIVLSMSIFYMVLGTRNYKMKDLFLGQLLAASTFVVYIRGALSALLGIKTTFGITEKVKGRSLPYIRLWPQMGMIFLNFTAFVWGVNRFIYERDLAVLVNGFWALYHFLLLSGVFYFNEEDISKGKCKKLLPGVSLEYRIVEEPGAIAGLSKETWTNCISTSLPKQFKLGTRILCKLRLPGKDTVIFEGITVWSAEKRSRRGFEANIGVATIAEEDKDKLKGFMHK
ncbi:MAG: glycosyltransferase [Omnitrophica bacterium]|nr:glycosyltransferase [Candidatus Omnitrophota bacterium]